MPHSQFPSFQLMTKQLQPWYWRKLPLKQLTGSDVFACLFISNPINKIAVLLESPYPNSTNNPQLARYSICGGVPRVIDGVPQMWTPELGGVLPFLRQLLEKLEKPEKPDKSEKPADFETFPPLPFTGGWLGWLGYDVAWEIEELPLLKSDSLPFPVAFWYEPEYFAVLDHWEQVLWLAASNKSELDKLEDKFSQQNQDLCDMPSASRLAYRTSVISNAVPSLKLITSQGDYEAAVVQAKKYIQAGDIFQTNLSIRFETQTNASGWEVYQALQKINPSPFASYFKTPWGEVVSCSPERLVQVYENLAQTRPIAGTRKRGKTEKEDRELAQELLSNSKERAEHIMLVDLERNDLGRVCEWGSVNVDELLTIERYSHVMHLVSNVKGTLANSHSPTYLVDLIGSMFPGGTITGCPKVRCMEIIEELEPVRRSLFYGSCGYLDRSGNLDLNILIRTLLVAPQASSGNLHHPNLNSVWGQVGAGIVADSNPTKEWYESLHKAQAQIQALQRV